MVGILSKPEVWVEAPSVLGKGTRPQLKPQSLLRCEGDLGPQTNPGPQVMLS